MKRAVRFVLKIYGIPSPSACHQQARFANLPTTSRVLQAKRKLRENRAHIHNDRVANGKLHRIRVLTIRLRA